MGKRQKGNWESDDRAFQQWSKELLSIANDIKDGKNSKKFLRKSGTKLRKKTIDQAKKTVKKYTGKYLESIKTGKVYEFKGNLSLRVFSASPHAHLIESGHRIVTPSGREKGFKPGYHVFEKAAKNFEDEFAEDTENFIQELLDDNDL